MGSVMTGGDLEDGMGFFFSKYNLLESKHQYSKKKKSKSENIMGKIKIVVPQILVVYQTKSKYGLEIRPK